MWAPPPASPLGARRAKCSSARLPLRPSSNHWRLGGAGCASVRAGGVGVLDVEASHAVMCGHNCECDADPLLHVDCSASSIPVVLRIDK